MFFITFFIHSSGQQSVEKRYFLRKYITKLSSSCSRHLVRYDLSYPVSVLSDVGKNDILGGVTASLALQSHAY